MNDYEPDKYEKMFWCVLWITFALALVLVLTFLYFDYKNLDKHQYVPRYEKAIEVEPEIFIKRGNNE